MQVTIAYPLTRVFTIPDDHPMPYAYGLEHRTKILQEELKKHQIPLSPENYRVQAVDVLSDGEAWFVSSPED